MAEPLNRKEEQENPKIGEFSWHLSPRSQIVTALARAPIITNQLPFRLTAYCLTENGIPQRVLQDLRRVTATVK